MTHILKCAFKGTFASFDGVGGLAQRTFCRADPAMENESLESKTPHPHCVSLANMT